MTVGFHEGFKIPISFSEKIGGTPVRLHIARRSLPVSKSLEIIIMEKKRREEVPYWRSGD
jgi:hypothetical protein